MPDTLTPEELAAIREAPFYENPAETVNALLAHLDALTAAAQAVVDATYPAGPAPTACESEMERIIAPLLAILRGAQ